MKAFKVVSLAYVCFPAFTTVEKGIQYTDSTLAF